jgi:arsenate reductase
LLHHHAGDRFEGFSAGVEPARGFVPEAVPLGIDISAHRPRHVDEFLSQHSDRVLTVCDHTHETCPVFPGSARMIHHSFEDPRNFPGSEEERVERFRRVRDKIRAYLRSFV